MRTTLLLCCTLFLHCSPGKPASAGACDQARYDQPGSRFRIEGGMVYDTTAASITVKTYDAETRQPIAADLLLTRDRDTLVGAADKLGQSTLLRNGIDGRWDLHLFAGGHRCLVLHDVVLRAGYGQVLSIGLRRQ